MCAQSVNYNKPLLKTHQQALSSALTIPNVGSLSKYSSQRSGKKKQAADHRGVGPIAGHTNMCWLLVLTNLYLKMNVCSECVIYGSWVTQERTLLICVQALGWDIREWVWRACSIICFHSFTVHFWGRDEHLFVVQRKMSQKLTKKYWTWK